MFLNPLVYCFVIRTLEPGCLGWRAAPLLLLTSVSFHSLRGPGGGLLQAARCGGTDIPALPEGSEAPAIVSEEQGGIT